MGELRQMIERAGFEKFMEFLSYGGETGSIAERDEEKDTYLLFLFCENQPGGGGLA